jgi:DNA polymerase I-like protein with 3'-5' exonuclease and polymerase domains
MTASKNFLFLGTEEDKAYLPHIKSMFGGMPVFYILDQIELLTHLQLYCSKKNITAVVSTNIHILTRLLALEGNIKINPSLDEYAGSLFEYKGIEILFVPPLDHIHTVSYGKWYLERMISKVTKPESWPEASAFSWTLLDAENVAHWESRLSHADLIAIDIETFRENLCIRCIGYTAIFFNTPGSGLPNIETKSFVLPIDSEFALAYMRKINANKVAKIFQNGKYDNAYLLRYNAPVNNWLWDTQYLFHSWYSELPKDLAFLNAFFLRKVVYWKDLAETKNLFDYYRYNALDTWATGNVFLQCIRTMPAWAKRNYALAFPLQFPCLLSEMTGLLRDEEALKEAVPRIQNNIVTKQKSLDTMLGSPINVNSSQQVKALLKILGCGDLTSSDKKALAVASFRHPLNGRILDEVKAIRADKKVLGTYLPKDEDSKDYYGTILYSLNPHGTETGRLASKESAFWIGFNIQNIPTGPVVKSTIKAAPGFYFGECDLEQAETRDTGHIAGEEKLIAAVTGTKDFHSLNAAAFFGKPYESLFDDEKKKTKNKPLRDISKRVNHGANYNMTAPTLVDTMGLKAIFEAKLLLKLAFTKPISIAQYLLDRFHATYPKLKGPGTPYSAGTYYAWVVKQILIGKKLVSRAYHHTAYNLSKYPDAKAYIEEGDWTRYCFGSPDKNKADLNAYVAHCPQSLNSRTLNEAYMEVFYKIALPNPATFRLHAQIHDSILFSYAKGWEIHGQRVKELMEIPVTVKDIDGKYRTFTVPAALKLGVGEGATHWSMLE